MSMRILKEIDAEGFLLRASELVARHGLSRCLTKTPRGELSLYGAIFVACGAHYGQMSFDCDDAESAGVPERFQAVADELCLYLETFCGVDDLNACTEDPVKVFNNAAMRLIILGS